MITLGGADLGSYLTGREREELGQAGQVAAAEAGQRAQNRRQALRHVRYAYNDANQLCWTAPAAAACTGVTRSDATAGATTYAYDANGNQTATSAGQAMASNAADQTTSMSAPNGSGPRAMTYAGATQDERLRSTRADYVHRRDAGAGQREHREYLDRTQ